jgi:hypothetical protein
MKGNPLLRIAVILLLLAAVFWPVLKITSPSKSSLPPSVAPAQTNSQTISSALSATILLHGAPVPAHCSVSQHGVLLLSETNSIAPGEYRASAAITKGDDLLITASWNDEEPHAIRLEVLVHGYQAHLEKTYWAQSQLEDTLPVPESFLP